MNQKHSTTPGRRSLRLQEYDYTDVGMYFITLCVDKKLCLFGNVVAGDMQLNSAGQIVLDSWEWLATQYDYVRLGEYVVMPNHLHGIIEITDNGSKHKSIGSLIGAFKTVSTKRINEIRGTQSAKLWQRNYYEHVIRNDVDYNRIAEYIIANPQRWEKDSLHPNYEAASLFL